jgi:predicted GNAT family acetyltransferase
MSQEERAQPVVTDERDRHRFTVTVDGVLAQLIYRLDGDRLVLEHTEVPDELGGRGLGGLLVRAAVDRAESDGLTIAPWCPFARRWLERHPDVTSTAAVDWSPPPSRG